jgi:hypothetical protein
VLLPLVALLWGALGSESSSAASWVAPLPEPLTVTRAFDPPDTPYGSGHRGVDLAASPGQAIRAAGPGTVVYAGPLAGRGVLSLQHADGLRTTYEPVLASVAAGVEVGLGQVIGTVQAGHVGCPAAACLHWGLKRGEVYLDPLLLLRQGPVRLLPRYAGARSATAPDPALLLPAGSATLNVLGLGLGLVTAGASAAVHPTYTQTRQRIGCNAHRTPELGVAPSVPHSAVVRAPAWGQARGCACR